MVVYSMNSVLLYKGKVCHREMRRQDEVKLPGE